MYENIGFKHLLLKSSNDIYAKYDSLSTSAAGLAQSIERLTAEREVAGSNCGAGPVLRV